MNKGILKILVKNFYIYFRKNWIQIFSLVLSVSLLLGLISGLQNTNTLINKNLQTINKISENNTINFNNNPFINKETPSEQYNNWIYGYNKWNSNNSFINTNKIYNDTYSLESLWFDSLNLNDKTTFNDKYFEIYQINQNIINEYNKKHIKKIIIDSHKVKSLYGLVLQNYDTNTTNNNSFNSLYKNYNYNFVNLDINEHTKNNKTLLFYDDLAYLRTKQITIPYKDDNTQTISLNLMYTEGILSNDNKQNKIPVSLYYANKLYDGYYKNLKDNDYLTINSNQWNATNTSLQKAGYNNSSSETKNINEYMYNFYVNNIKNLLYEATTFSSIYNIRRYEHFTTTNLDNENNYLFIKYNDKLTYNNGYSTIDQKFLTGYKKDGTSFYNLKEGQILVNSSYYFGNNFNSNSYLTFLNYDKKFRIVGKTMQANIIVSFMRGPNYKNNGAIWLNPKDYDNLKNKLKALPQTNVSYNNYLGYAMIKNPLNPNLNFQEQKELVNSNKGQLGSLRNNPYSLYPKSWSNYLKYKIHFLYIYFVVKQRIDNMNLIIIVFIILFSISSLVTIFIIINKIIKNNSFIIGNLKANGLKMSNIIISISTPINTIIILGALFAILLGFLTSTLLIYSFKIGCNLVDYQYIYDLKMNSIIIFIPLIIMLIYNLFFIYLKTRTNTLFLLNNKEKQNNNLKFLITFISKLNRIKLLSFNSKISIKFAWNAKLKIFMCLIMSTVLSVMLYLSLSCSIIYAQISYTFNQLDFNYTYYLNKNIEARSTTTEGKMEQRFNVNDLVDFNNPGDKVYHIHNLINKDDTVNLPKKLMEHYSLYGFKYTWFYAKELQEIYNESLKDSFDNSIIKASGNKITKQDIKNMQNEYLKNKFIIENAVRNNAILSIGFQFYNKKSDNLVSQSYISTHIVNSIDDIKNKKYLSNNKNTITMDIKSYINKTDELYHLNRVHMGPSPSDVLNSDDYDKYINNQEFTNIENYLKKKVANNKNDYFIEAPLFMNLRTNKESLNNQVNKNLFAEYTIESSNNKHFTLYILLNLMDTVKTIERSDNFTTNSVIQNIIKYSALRHLDNIQDNPYYKNYPNVIYNIYSQDPTNYYKKYIGIYNKFDKYFSKDYTNSSILRTYLYGFTNTKTLQKYGTQDVKILFLIINLVSILSLIICAIQIILTIELMVKDNINNINLFKSMGYSRIWIFKKIFLIFIPIIAIAILISGPIAFTISNSFYKIFSKLIGFALIPTISYLNVFWTLFILISIYILLYIVIEKYVTSKAPLNKFIT